MSQLIQRIGAPAMPKPDEHSVILCHSESTPTENDRIDADLKANRHKAERAQSYNQRQALRLQIQHQDKDFP